MNLEMKKSLGDRVLCECVCDIFCNESNNVNSNKRNTALI